MSLKSCFDNYSKSFYDPIANASASKIFPGFACGFMCRVWTRLGSPCLYYFGANGLLIHKLHGQWLNYATDDSMKMCLCSLTVIAS